ILINQGKYRLSLPNAFRNLGLKATNKKYYSSARTAAENMILQAAAVLGEQPPLFEHFGPAERVKWKRTRNLLHGKEQSAGDIQFVRFRPIEVGWSPLIRHVVSPKCTLATKVVLLYAYLRGFESGQFWASSQNTSVNTDVHKVHVKRIFPWLVKHRHFEKLNREAEGTWRYAFLAPSDFINAGNFKLPLN